MQRYSAPPFGWLPSLHSTTNVLRLVGVYLQILHLCSSADIGVIGVLTEVTNPIKCEKIVPTIVYETESLKWMLNILNANNYTNDIKLEIDIMDTCEAKSSVTRTIELISKYKTGPKKLIGILSMTTSANMLNVSWFLSSLPENDRLIQIGTRETAYKLNNRTLYPTFFRVIRDDEYQFELIADLLELLKWNYIAILHEKDVYGEEGAKLLIQNLPAHRVTLAVQLGLDNAKDNINEQLFRLRTDYSGVKAVVIIAQPWTLENIFEKRAKDFRFIFTESLMIDKTLPNAHLFPNSFAILRQPITFSNVEKHWKKLFNTENVRDNTMFRSMIEQHGGCPDALNSSCNLTAAAGKLSKIIHKTSVLPKLVGLYIFAFLLREKNARCVKLHCQLSAVKLGDIQGKTIDLSYLSTILSYPSINKTETFNDKGNLIQLQDLQAYQVYYNTRESKYDPLIFKKVSEYRNKTLELSMDAVKNSEMWGVCRVGQYCRKDIPKFIYKEGDIMLFGIVPIRAGNKAESCPSYEKLNSSQLLGSQLAEAMFYAVETLNQKKLYKNLFPNKRIGIIVMDSCNQEIPTFKAMFSFWRGSASICRKILNCSAIMAKTFVYIGGLTSEVSIRILQLMNALNTVQISYASTSSVFRDPLILEYPHFLRLTPSNSLQIVAMIDICVRMKWRYVSLIYVDNAYGRSAQRELISKAKDSKVCVTQSLQFAIGSDLNKLLEKLKRRPEAKVVIVFLNSANLETVMTFIVKNMKEGEFTFLGSEAWGRYLRIDKVGEKIRGSLSLGIDIPSNSEFEDYRKRTELSIYKSNPWTLAALESRCYMNLSLNKKSPKPCPPKLTLSYLGEENQWASMVIQSVYAAAIGLNMSISQLCDNKEVCPKLFKKFPEVVEIFKKVELKDPDGKYKRIFDANGDGVRSYIVYKIQAVDKKLVYMKIGHWSKKSGLVLDVEKIDTPPLSCPNQKRCSECPIAQTEQDSSENYIPPMIGFIFLLLILIGVVLLYWKCSKFIFDHNDLGSIDTINNNSNPYLTPRLPDNNEPMNDSSTYTEIRDTNPKAVRTRLSESLNPAYEGFQPHRNITDVDTQNNLNNLSMIPPKRDSTKDLCLGIQNEGAQDESFAFGETRPKQFTSEDDSMTYLKELAPVAPAPMYPESDDDEQINIHF